MTYTFNQYKLYYICFYSLQYYPCTPPNPNNEEGSVGDVCMDEPSFVIIGVLGKNHSAEEFGNEFELQIKNLQ